jgi:hypothetical protein
MNCAHCSYPLLLIDASKHLFYFQKILSFRAFGPLRYARITLDHTTGRGRGTGFACFWNKEDADKAIAQSDLLKAETRGAVPSTVRSIVYFNPYSSLTFC